MSETPRTDKLDQHTKGRNLSLACGMHIELSRQLERELAAMTELADKRLKDRWDISQELRAMTAERDSLLAEITKEKNACVMKAPKVTP